MVREKVHTLLIVFALLIGLSACGMKKGGPPPDPSKVEVPPVPVKFERLGTQSISDTFQTAGELKANKEVIVSAESAGQIESILVSEGQWVDKGQLLIKIKGEDVKADLDLAKVEQQRFKSLHEAGAASKQELDQADATLRRLEARLDNLEIKALFSGTVGQIFPDPGDYVRLGDQILELVKVNPLRVTYTIPEKLIPVVKVGQRVSIVADSDPSESVKATVNFVSPRVEPATRSVLVRAKLDYDNLSVSGHRLLKANQFVTVNQELRYSKNALVVREESIYLDQGQQYLYIAVAKDKPVDAEEDSLEDENELSGSYTEKQSQDYIAERVAIKTGARKEGLVEIVSSEQDKIKKGVAVIYSGLQRIYPGAKLLDVSEN